jgi:alanine-alpha-ketoisovalerate/valine-pyruvate aminotransferase
MKKVAFLVADDLAVDLTLHDFSAALIAEFAKKIVRPYYSGKMRDAVKALMQKAIREEQFVLNHVKRV